MVLALQLMASINDAALRQELSRLPEVGERLIDRAVSLGESLGNDIGIRKYAFIGSGPLYGIARECQLKVKEMTLLPSDCYPLMDYRHGPKSNVDESMLVTMLCSDSGRKWEQECAEELKKHGGQLLLMSDSPVGVSDTNSFYFESGLSEYARAILYLPVIQAMATYRALSLGMDPDNPKNLSYWVKTNSLDTPDDKTDPEPLTTGRQGK
jgi:glucosamine--fructose-6-phosphate aminotransferase (isomerizing)